MPPKPGVKPGVKQKTKLQVPSRYTSDKYVLGDHKNIENDKPGQDASKPLNSLAGPTTTPEWLNKPQGLSSRTAEAPAKPVFEEIAPSRFSVTVIHNILTQANKLVKSGYHHCFFKGKHNEFGGRAECWN